MSTESSSGSSPEPATGGKRKTWRRLLIVLAALVVVLYAGIGWYVSGEMIAGFVSERFVIEYDTDVVSVSADEITLDVTDAEDIESDDDAVMGVRWDGGYGRVGPSITNENGVQTRPFELARGELPPTGPDVIDFDSFAFRDDPSVVGIDFETVTYPSELGDLEAWFVPGTGSTWIIGVHGRNSERAEFLRLLNEIADLQYPMLMITYRNDAGAPPTDAGVIRFGQDEWRDLDAAVDYALANGADDVVIAAPSMGGAITLSYTLETDAKGVRALILEAPAADFREIVQLRSGEALPVGGVIGDSFLAAGRLFTWLRTGLSFDTVDYIDRAEALDVPILLFHGRSDTVVPFAIGQALAEARPDLVEFHPIEDGAHVRAWNEDPEAYGRIVRDFLSDVGRS